MPARAKLILCATFLGSATLCTAAESGSAPTGTAAAQGSTASVQQACRIDLKGDRKDEWKREPRSASSSTMHRINAGGRSVEYIATAGLLVIRDDEDKPMANMSYVAYTRRDVKAGDPRPIMFAFNGGPGSSSMWLHMGALGPRRVAVSDPQPTPPAAYKLVDNEYGVLDRSDLVMIDPVGTGLSRAVCDHKDDEFWGVDPDIDSVSRFIAQFVSDNNRWTSPKYLLGESYGTTRAAAVANDLRVKRSLDLNGLILVSVATDVEAIFAELPGNERPYMVYLPGFAAVAWYQHALPGAPPALEPFLQEVRAYALGPYAAALLKGDALGESEREAVAAKLHEYTGLSTEYLKQSNLRVSELAFTHELLRAQRKTVGRLDGRFVGDTLDQLSKYAEYDPQSAAISAAFVATFNDYLHGELKFGQGETYRATNFAIGEKWKWTHRPTGAEGEQPIVNSGVDLALALTQDASLQVLVLNGYYDLATPFSATEYMMSHLGVPPGASTRIHMQYYEAGHMMYVNPASLRKMKSDMDAFIEATARH